MFQPRLSVQIRLYRHPVDMRKSFDGLAAIARHTMGGDPLSGQIFVFINRRRTQIKALYFDHGGYCVWAKRLSQGQFFYPDQALFPGDEMRLTEMMFQCLVDGIEPSRAAIRKRFSPALVPGKIGA